jgi:hypothetical protein
MSLCTEGNSLKRYMADVFHGIERECEGTGTGKRYAMKEYGQVDVWINSLRKSRLYPLDRRLGGPQNRSARRGEKSRPYRDSNSVPSAVPVDMPTA